MGSGLKSLMAHEEGDVCSWLRRGWEIGSGKATEMKYVAKLPVPGAIVSEA